MFIIEFGVMKHKFSSKKPINIDSAVVQPCLQKVVDAVNFDLCSNINTSSSRTILFDFFIHPPTFSAYMDAGTMVAEW